MANHLGIYSFSQSLADYLAQSYAIFQPEPGSSALPSAGFEVLSSSDFNSEKEIKNKVTLYLHRVVPNSQLRNLPAGQALGAIGLDLHYLLTVWADKASEEQILLGWAIRELHYHSLLNGSSLSEDAAWAVDETISIVPADLSAEEMSRIWEVAQRGYRLSYPFLARIVRLFRTTADETTPTVARRFTHTDNLLERSP